MKNGLAQRRAGRTWPGSWYRHVYVAAACLLGMIHIARAENSPVMMLLTTPGESLGRLDISEHAHPPPLTLAAAWYAVSIKDGNLVLQTAQTTRKPDWTLIFKSIGTPADSGSVDPEETEPQHALDLPDSALLGFRLLDKDKLTPLPLHSGSYPSALQLPVTLHDRWQATLQLDGKTWHLSTETMRRKDGALLAGSLSLVATSDSGEKQVLLPPTDGAAFERQELLWLGSIHSRKDKPEIDLLIKRTWLTGKVEYVWKVGEAIESELLDPDHPYAVGTSGVEASMETKVPVQQHHPLPPDKFGTAAFTISQDAWNPALDAAEKDGLPKLLFDRQLELEGEKLRFTIEYLPRVSAENSPLAASRIEYWGGPVLVKAHFRGTTQVLLETDRLDDGSFTLQVGKLGDEKAIQVATQPHYNNSFVYDWIWDATQQRFVRLYRRQDQGC